MKLLMPDEPAACSCLREQGRSPFLLVCDHASNRIPRRLADLGLPAEARSRHIAWDIGIAGVARRMAETLDACTIMSGYSRLVIDCNRPAGAPDSITPVSDGVAVPGNRNLSAEDIRARREEIFQPYHDRIEAELERRAAQNIDTILVALHSFTPVFGGVTRPVQAGVLYNRDDRFARILLELLRREVALVVGDNDPYNVTDATDYTVPVHGERRGLHHAALEVRQDLIADESGQQVWADRLSRLLREALSLVQQRQ